MPVASDGLIPAARSGSIPPCRAGLSGSRRKSWRTTQPGGDVAHGVCVAGIVGSDANRGFAVRKDQLEPTRGPATPCEGPPKPTSWLIAGVLLTLLNRYARA